jgi:DNA (cytosine-5)-methyltransferase 1
MIKYTQAFEDERDNINFEDSELYAYVTHFLQNMGTEYAGPFSDQAIKGLLEKDSLREGILNGNHINGEASKEAFNNLTLDLDFDVPFPPVDNQDFSFIDLFAGVGGFRLALQELGGKCVFSSEIDKYCKQTYEANFGEIPFGNIKKFTDESIDDGQLKKLIPEHDILAAGFPCQAFSIAGKRGGFEDTRGTLFFDIARILKAKKPKAFILENVKGLRNHRSGKTLTTILNVLRDKDELNYFVPDPKVLNAKDFGVPQNRERILIVGFRKDLNITDFTYPTSNLEDSLFKTGSNFAKVKESEEVSVKYYLSDTYLETLREHKKRHERKGNGFGYEVIEDDDTANAIVVGGMGRERNLVWDHRLTNFEPVTNIKGKVNREGIRRMTPREWARLQGFPDEFRIDIVSDTQAYKQFGNSVPVPVIEALGAKVKEKLSVNV